MKGNFLVEPYEWWAPFWLQKRRRRIRRIWSHGYDFALKCDCRFSEHSFQPFDIP